MDYSIPTRGPRVSAPPRREEPRDGAPRPRDAAPGFRGNGHGHGHHGNSDRRRMLDLRREGHFKYDLKEVLAKSRLPPEQVAAFAATVFSKGSRQSTGEAKDWVTSKLHENVIAKPERDAINTLLDRYSKWR